MVASSPTRGSWSGGKHGTPKNGEPNVTKIITRHQLVEINKLEQINQSRSLMQ
jgi:hypothetical protein